MVKKINQSVVLVLIQLANIVFGLLTTFVIAANIPSGVFSILGVGDVVVLLVSTFSFVGVEDFLKQNTLVWCKINKKRLSFFISQALVYRVVLFFLFLPIVLWYLSWYREIKLENMQFSMYLYLFLISAVLRSIIHSVGLILNALGRFVEIALANSIIIIFSKLIGLFFFFYFDFGAFIIVYCFTPLLLAPLLIWRIREYIKPKYIFMNKRSLRIIRSNMSFGFASYMRFISNYSYSFIASFVLSAEVFSSYTIVNRLVQNSEQLYRNLFLPKLQSFIAIKFDFKALQFHVNKHFKFVHKLIILQFIAFVLLWFLLDELIMLVHMNEYPILKELILIAVFFSAIYAYNFNYKSLIVLFMSSKDVLKFELVSIIIFFISLSIVVISLPNEYLLAYRILTETCLLAILNVFYKKRLLIKH